MNELAVIIWGLGGVNLCKTFNGAVSGGFKAIGITFLVSGIALVGIFVTVQIIPTVLERNAREIINAFAPLADTAINSIVFIGIALAAVGAIALATTSIIKSISNKRENSRTPAADTWY